MKFLATFYELNSRGKGKMVSVSKQRVAGLNLKALDGFYHEIPLKNRTSTVLKLLPLSLI